MPGASCRVAAHMHPLARHVTAPPCPARACAQLPLVTIQKLFHDVEPMSRAQRRVTVLFRSEHWPCRKPCHALCFAPCHCPLVMILNLYRNTTPCRAYHASCRACCRACRGSPAPCRRALGVVSQPWRAVSQHQAALLS